MRNAISALLLVCATAVLAQEPKPPEEPAAAAPPTAAPTAPPAADPARPLRLPDDLLKLLPGGSLQLPDGRMVQLNVPRNSGTCYFIRTLKPVMSDEEGQRSGFIPLQARVLGTVSEPACANGGTLQPLVPVRRVLLKTPE